MTREMIVLPRAEAQLLDAAMWWSENRSPAQAVRWLEGFEEALSSLETDTRRLTIAPEDTLLDFSFKVRQLAYGLGNRPTHRAIVEIRESIIYVHSTNSTVRDVLNESK